MLQVIMLTVIAALVGIDQLTKFLAIRFLENQPPVPIIDGVFELTFLRNPGAAFGLGAGMRWLLISVTSVVVIFLLVVLLSGKFKMYKVVNISAILIIAGGIGNLIDRVFFGKVVDFLYFKLIDFPVFNFADCCVVVGAILLLVYVFFFYSDEKIDEKKKAATSVTRDTIKITLPEDWNKQTDGIVSEEESCGTQEPDSRPDADRE